VRNADIPVRIVSLTLLALTLGSCGDRGDSQPRAANARAQRPRDQDVAAYWNRRSCSVGPNLALPEVLVADADGNRKRFTAALLEAVPADVLTEVRAAAQTRYQWWQELLKEEVMTVCIPKADRDYLTSMSESEFVETAEADFLTAYQARAITGLGVVGSDDPKVRARVRDLAADRRSPLAASARWTLERWGN